MHRFHEASTGIAAKPPGKLPRGRERRDSYQEEQSSMVKICDSDHASAIARHFYAFSLDIQPQTGAQSPSSVSLSTKACVQWAGKLDAGGLETGWISLFLVS
jgi:hypothetical protein